MNQLFYDITGGIVHKIRREKRTTISEVIVRGKREILSKINEIEIIFFISIFLLKAGVYHSYDYRPNWTPLIFYYHYLYLFLPHLNTLAHAKRSENCLRFATSGPSLCLYPLL